MEVHHGELSVEVGAGGETDQAEVIVVGESILGQTQLQGGLSIEEVP